MIYALSALKDVYHQIYIKKDDEWKTVICIHYSHFKYIIILFKLVNASATFQTYINWVLIRLINIFYIIYLKNILKQYYKHVKEMLERL